MASPSRERRPRHVLILLVLTALALLTFDFRGLGPLQSAQDGVRSVLQPIADGLDTGVSPVRRTWHAIVDYDDLERENEELRAELEEARSDELADDDAAETLEEILAQEDIEQLSDVETVLSRVVGGAPSNFENTVRLDKGRSSGIRPNMAVLTDAGLVGRVVEVSEDRSVVELADTRGFGVGVRVVGTVGQSFVVRGRAPDEPLAVQGEVLPNRVEDGDRLVTSGLDLSLFPPDIPVGVVQGVEEAVAESGGDDDEPVDGVEVELFADLDRLSFVTVLLWVPEES
ncbi:MAG: rod shape-determining protein MreC [Actinomycetota bacterium]|nr:rod shape-determining protein MreC [Actinomycetota bacterium]